MALSADTLSLADRVDAQAATIRFVADLLLTLSPPTSSSVPVVDGNHVHPAVLNQTMVKLTLVSRGRYSGRPIDPRTGKVVEVSEAEHFYRCECGSWVDCRDLGMVFGHWGTLPHPGGDRDQ